MNNTNKTILIGLMIFAAIASSTSALTYLPQVSKSQSTAATAGGGGAAATAGGEGGGSAAITSEVTGSFANVKIVQDADTIIITVGKTATEIPPGPIIIVPPEEPGDNGTIITPPVGNETGNNTVIGGNGSVIEVPGNVTITDDNQTVIITDENNTITEIPENITVITPPPAEPCGCPPPSNETGAPQPPPDVIVIPAPGQNVTTGEPETPSEGNVSVIEPGQPPAAGNVTEEQPPAAAGNVTETPAPPSNATETQPPPPSNATQPEEQPPSNATETPSEPPTQVPPANETELIPGGDNETIIIQPAPPEVNITDSNVTVTPPANETSEPPQATQLPASSTDRDAPLFWINFQQ